MSWVIFSSTSVSKVLLGWLEPSLDLKPFLLGWEELKLVLRPLPLSFLFLEEGGDLRTL